MSAANENVVEAVRDRYGKIARGEVSGCCGPTGVCGGSAETKVALEIGYGRRELDDLPEGANLGLGCGAPLAALDLVEGEAVLDLGSGAGIDALIAARKVGPKGRVIGVDMTPDMLERARGNAARGGFTNVEFREGRLEALPVEAGSVDAITSNCVINLVPDKAAVFREAARVLKPGGRMVVSDIVLDGRLPEAIEKDVYAYVGCVSGAMQRDDYFGLLRAAGFEVEVLKDVDYLAAMEEAAPEEARALLERSGVGREEVVGRVRSLTYRARKAEACCAPSCCGGGAE
ncbi:MAG TPA: arsenite methyltransferase [Vicinamibacteria bacterium]|nr:arsenite methyltransferase [Vicinamibacteria bacterium]